MVQIKCHLHLPPKLVTIRQTKSFNCVNFINDLLNINWDRLKLMPYVNEAWKYFYDEVLNVINIHAPLRVVKVKGHHLPWVSSELLFLFKQRDKAGKKLVSHEILLTGKHTNGLEITAQHRPEMPNQTSIRTV